VTFDLASPVSPLRPSLHSRSSQLIFFRPPKKAKGNPSSPARDLYVRTPCSIIPPLFLLSIPQNILSPRILRSVLYASLTLSCFGRIKTLPFSYFYIFSPPLTLFFSANPPVRFFFCDTPPRTVWSGLDKIHRPAFATRDPVERLHFTSLLLFLRFFSLRHFHRFFDFFPPSGPAAGDAFAYLTLHHAGSEFSVEASCQATSFRYPLLTRR